MNRKLFDSLERCCGCEACANVCSKGLIIMKEDAEGFCYPTIVNGEMCVNCGLCGTVCPERHIHSVEGFQEKTFAGYAISDSEILSSASGGLATALSRAVINEGGFVYGVGYSADFESAEFTCATSIEELEAFKGSKYIQARKGNVYQNVKESLKENRDVLFIGLPCECNALRLFLRKDYPNLYVCALICHGPTSPEVHKQYIRTINPESKKITGFSVRYKKEGWKPYYIRAHFADRTEFITKFDETEYGTAFQYMKRPSCNSCRIKRSAINSDLTIGDYHLASGGNAVPYNRLGVSSTIVHTQKGEALLQRLRQFYLEQIPLKNVMYSEAYHRAIPEKANRKEFGTVFSQRGLVAACSLKSIHRIERKEAMIRTLRKNAAIVKRMLTR